MPWQPAAMVYPDAELWACDYLHEALQARPEVYAADVYVGNRIPSGEDEEDTGGRRDRMVIVRRDGGLEGELVDNARLSLQVWATTDQEASDLARLVRGLLFAAPTGAPLVRISLESGPTDSPDESGQPCKYLVVTAALRGVPLEGVS